jgi:hypothetical protein
VRKFFKTTFSFTVLTENVPVADVSPEEAFYLCSEGSGIGEFKRTRVKELTAKQAATALKRMGRPGSFHLDNDGNFKE